MQDKEDSIKANTIHNSIFSNEFLDEILRVFSENLSKKVLKGQFRVFQKLLSITVSSIHAFTEEVPAFYSKLLVKCIYNTIRNDQCYSNKISTELKHAIGFKSSSNIIDKLGLNISSRNLINTEYLILIKNIKENMISYFGAIDSSAFPTEFSWLNNNFKDIDDNLTKEKSYSTSSLSKNDLVKSIFTVMNNDVLEFDKFKFYNFLSIKEYEKNLKLVLFLFLDTRNSVVLRDFLKVCPTDVFTYYFNMEINKLVLPFFLLQEKQYDMACEVLYKANSENVYFEKRTYKEVTTCFAGINVYISTTEEQDAKRLISKLPASFKEFISTWRGVEGQKNPSYENALKSFIQDKCLTFTNDYEAIHEDFDDYIEKKDTFFNTRYPFIIEIENTQSFDHVDYKVLKIHLFQHKLHPSITDLNCNYQCDTVLLHLKTELAKIFVTEKEYYWVFKDEDKCKIITRPGSATLEVTILSSQFDEVIRILQHPFFQLKEGFNLTLSEVTDFARHLNLKANVKLLKQSNKSIHLSTPNGQKFTITPLTTDNIFDFSILGLDSDEAFHLVYENLSKIKNTIIGAVKEALLEETFIHYLQDNNSVSPDLLERFKDYQLASSSNAPHDDLLENIFAYAFHTHIQEAFIRFEMIERKDKAETPHFSIIQATAELQKINLNLWTTDNDNNLIPYPYKKSKDLTTENTIDLITNGKQFGYLNLLTSPQLVKKEFKFSQHRDKYPTFLSRSSLGKREERRQPDDENKFAPPGKKW